MKPKKAKLILQKALHDLAECRWLFSNNPQKDFTRKRKLPFEKAMKDSAQSLSLEAYDGGEDPAPAGVLRRRHSI